MPEPRGPVSEILLDRLARPVHELCRLPELTDDPIEGEDAALALYLMYELHYRGVAGADEGWEWEPSLLRERQRFERAFESRLSELAGLAPIGLSEEQVLAQLRHLATSGDGPSLSGFIETEGTLEHVRELAVQRSAYQLKEADPHTWAIPRLTGRAKAAMVTIQKDEYGDGRPEAVHATLFAGTMRGLGLDPTYGAYIDLIPALGLSTCNLISLFGLHRRWRAALVGHLAMFEMCSVTPMGRYSRALRRLGLGDDVTRFYDEHVVADEHHQVVALDDMVGGLLEQEPILGGEVVFGAMALQKIEERFATTVLAHWNDGGTSLRAPLA